MAFLGGLVIGDTLYQGIVGGVPALPITTNSTQLLIAGLLVGIGVTISNGCTSGHGILGIARLSGRSLVAKALFMTSAIITVAVVA